MKRIISVTLPWKAPGDHSAAIPSREDAKKIWMALLPYVASPDKPWTYLEIHRGRDAQSDPDEFLTINEVHPVETKTLVERKDFQ